MNIRIPSLPILGGLALVLSSILFSGQAFAVRGCLDIIKEVSPDGGITWYDANTESEAVSISMGAVYKITVLNCGLDEITGILVTDDVLAVTQPLADFPKASYDPINDVWTPSADFERSFTIEAPEICKNVEGTLLNTATVTGTATHYQELLTDSDDAWIRCETVTTGGEGCTPGYWKQPQHFDSWPAGVTPETAYSSIFDRIITVRTRDAGMVTDPTLLQALSALGGKTNTAARHSTAAYLNSVTGGVSYDLSAEQVISNLQISIDNNDFGDLIEALVSFNEQGCPLN